MTKEDFKSLVQKSPLTNKDKMLYTDDYSTAKSDYVNHEWYTTAKNTDKDVVWSQPYVDGVTKITMVASTAPFYDKQKKFMGTKITQDKNVSLAALGKDILSGDTGEASFSDSNGKNRKYYENAAEQIAVSIQAVAIGTDNQVILTDETTKVVGEIFRGMENIEGSVHMNKINDKVMKSSNIVNLLGKKSSQVGNIVTLITQMSIILEKKLSIFKM